MYGKRINTQTLENVVTFWLWDRRFPWILSPSGMLSSVDWFRTDVSEILLCSIVKSQELQEDILTLQDGTNT